MPQNYDATFGIDICLKCDKPECNNCLANMKQAPVKPVQKKFDDPVKPEQIYDIVQMWILGCPVKDIAHEVFLSRKTVLKVLQMKGYVPVKVKV